MGPPQKKKKKSGIPPWQNDTLSAGIALQNYED